MSKESTIPNAWDDDWESQADKADSALESAQKEQPIRISKAERLAKHAETNKQIWQSAYVLTRYILLYHTDRDSREEPETFHFLAARDNVPLKQEFKPALKVLSRKPAVQRIDPATGLAKLTLEDDDEEEDQKKNQPTPEELRLKAQREREEKQRRYDEARARILGSPSGSSTPGTVTPPAEDGRDSRGKNRGVRKGERQENRRADSQPSTKELFDPNYTPKPGIAIQKRSGEISRPGRQILRDEEQVIRAPRGPDGSGRGGFGFANRGAKKS
jgi:hypothetical protein